ncbi:hypothetical protein PC128_g23970 [Phytophthora cactorum]|nr:hypothetical protein PC128_g23970 [Phytophthora cactorum]
MAADKQRRTRAEKTKCRDRSVQGRPDASHEEGTTYEEGEAARKDDTARKEADVRQEDDADQEA